MKPELFGPYRLDELIGRGGMGEVYRAFDTRRGRVVALKRLPLASAADTEFMARFRREAAIAARLHSPHVGPIHDYGDVDGHLFIDMRLVPGTDLGKLLTDHGPLAPARAVGIITQVASALDDAHAEKLVHRDVKPSNVLLTREDFAYLADFGIVRALAGGTVLTATGTAVGTWAYMAPERFLGQPGDGPADIYALACVLYESLTGHPPFAGEDLPGLMYAHVHLPPPRASQRRPGRPTGLDEVITRGMAKDPTERFATAGELARAANTALGAVTPTDTTEPETVVPRRPPPQTAITDWARYPRRRKRTLIGLAVLATVVASVFTIISIMVLGQYYVGVASNGEVGIFQGVGGEFLGLPLHSWAEGSCQEGARGCESVFLRDLKPYAQTDVRRGLISNAGLDGARKIIGRLRTNDLLPPCQPNSAAAQSGTQAHPVEAPSAAATEQGGGSASTTTGTPLPDKLSEPGVDCRTMR